MSLIFLAVVVVASAVLTPAAAAADEPDADVVSVRVTPTSGSAATGYLTVVAEVALRSDGAIDDVIELDPYSLPTIDAGVHTERVTGNGATLIWPRLERVSGSSTDGVWRGVVTVSPAWAGSHRVIGVQVTGRSDSGHFFLSDLPVADGPVVTIEATPWVITGGSVPVRVVTGNEPWRPRVTVRDASTGQPVPGARLMMLPASVCPATVCLSVTQARLSAPPQPFTDSTGTWTSLIARISPPGGGQDEPQIVRAYGSRGTRGWSMQGEGACVGRTEKWQANARFSSLALPAGHLLTVTGNAWPAPDVAAAPGRIIHLERQVRDGSWRVLASGHVRDNGRYTISWRTDHAGTSSIRVRKPGGVDGCGDSVGTTLAPVRLVVA